jgi:hypothetical protein
LATLRAEERKRTRNDMNRWPKWLKLVVACLLCLGVVWGLVVLLKSLF